MSTTTTRQSRPVAAAPVARSSTLITVVIAAAVLAAIVGWLLPDRTVGGGATTGMSMTHYMGLVSINQPWNLLLFMAVPVILAETLAITDRAYIMYDGSILVSGTASEIAGNARAREIYLGERFAL